MKTRVSCLLVLAMLAWAPSILQAEELTIFTEEWRPISFSEGEEAKGLAVEVVQEILNRLGRKEPIKVVPWARGWNTLLEKPNVVLFTMTRTEEREKLFTMIGPVAIGTTNLYAKKGAGLVLKNLDDAKKMKSIGVYRSAVEEQILTKEGFTNLDATTLPLQAAKMLVSGRVDLWCNANLTAGDILKEAGFSITDVENVFTVMKNELYIALSKGTSEETINQWLTALDAMKKDGTFAVTYHKWLPGEEAPERTERVGAAR